MKCKLTRPNFILTDISPRGLGIDTSTGVFSVIIPPFSSLPATRSKDFWPPKVGLKKMDIVIYEGDNRLSVDNHRLGEYVVPLPDYKSIDEAAFTIRLDMDMVVFLF